ncbi:hypothetical protein P261_01090 [Lachnospiraceae bacterium TWA4]|nr:hypothetical protein P261_01090 [Lachnospiraceae bacterium TWA4]
MSVRINKENCVKCGRCIEACPGNLIKKDSDGKAFILHERDCWGCTSCLKECKHLAIDLFLGADMGGKGEVLKFYKEKEENIWEMTALDGTVKKLKINPKESNKY